MVLALLTEETAETVNGGTFTSGAWRTRQLAVKSDINGLITQVSSGRFRLKPGYFYFEGFAMAYSVDYHQTRLFDITNNLVIEPYGLITAARTATLESGLSLVRAVYRIQAETDIEMQHRCSTTQANTGFGQASPFPNANLFAALSVFVIGNR